VRASCAQCYRHLILEPLESVCRIPAWQRADSPRAQQQHVSGSRVSGSALRSCQAASSCTCMRSSLCSRCRYCNPATAHVRAAVRRVSISSAPRTLVPMQSIPVQAQSKACHNPVRASHRPDRRASPLCRPLTPSASSPCGCHTPKSPPSSPSPRAARTRPRVRRRSCRRR